MSLPKVSSLTNPNANLILDRVIDAIRTLLVGLEDSKLIQSRSQPQLHPQPLPNSNTAARTTNANQQNQSVGIVDNNQTQPQPHPIPDSSTVASSSNANQQDKSVGVGDQTQTQTQTQIQAQPLPDSNTTASSSNGNQQNRSVGVGVDVGVGVGVGVAEDDDYQSLNKQIVKLSRDLVYIRNAFVGLKNFEESALDLLKNLEHFRLDELLSESSTHHPHDVASRNKWILDKLRVLSETVMRLKLQIPSPHKISSVSLETGRTFRMASGNDAQQLIGKLSQLHSSPTFKDSPHFKDFQVIYKSLDATTKLCLLCFAAFPANEVVNKRLLVYWWHGEGFLEPPVDRGKTIMDVADDQIFQELVNKGCIEPIKTKRARFCPDGFKMHLVIHSSVSVLAEEAGFFDFDNGSPTVNFSKSFRACLVKGSSQKILKLGLEPEDLQAIFNVNEPYPDFELEWFSKLRNVKVLSLGRWQDTAKHHIEVEGVEFLKGLRNLIHLRFLSLQGISRITELPASICMLSSLRILDLRACHNLEALPDGIGSLKKLTHLDISSCYLLDYMPKGIAMLSELQVLKGFVVGDDKDGRSCPLNYLSSLQKLEKLSINTSREDFPRQEELRTLQSFGKLQKLTIAWGAISFSAQPANGAGEQNATTQPIKTSTAKNARVKKKRCSIKTKNLKKLPTFRRSTTLSTKNKEPFKELKKLDIQCYPLPKAPSWLIPNELGSLKKLYIRGGELQDLALQGIKWKSVKILRLKFLRELSMDWIDLKESFPELTHLEKVKCPKLTFFPCDENGIWVSDRSSVISR